MLELGCLATSCRVSIFTYRGVGWKDTCPGCGTVGAPIPEGNR